MDLIEQSEALGDIHELESHLEVLKHKRAKHGVPRINRDQFAVLGILRPGEGVDRLQDRLNELLKERDVLEDKLEKMAPRGEHQSAARRRFLALQVMRESMKRQRERNQEALKEEIAITRQDIDRMSPRSGK
jgi:hypothetical protein